eukprot:2285096-Pleurochrysis_carterae.AAC.1
MTLVAMVARTALARVVAVAAFAKLAKKYAESVLPKLEKNAKTVQAHSTNDEARGCLLVARHDTYCLQNL